MAAMYHFESLHAHVLQPQFILFEQSMETHRGTRDAKKTLLSVSKLEEFTTSVKQYKNQL